MLQDARALAALEKETLTTICRIGPFAKLGEICQDASKYVNRIHGGHVDAHLALVMDLGLRSDRGVPVKRRIDLSAQVTSGAAAPSHTSSASYSVVLCDGLDRSGSSILRKFHFDYEAVEGRNHAEPKPTTHMQICGQLSGRHIEQGYSAKHVAAWYPALEKPRVPVQPTCIALLVNWILLEFSRDHDATTILKNDQWKKLVRKAERQILLPYFQDAASFLATGGNERSSFFTTHLYQISE